VLALPLRPPPGLAHPHPWCWPYGNGVYGGFEAGLTLGYESGGFQAGCEPDFLASGVREQLSQSTPASILRDGPAFMQVFDQETAEQDVKAQATAAFNEAINMKLGEGLANAGDHWQKDDPHMSLWVLHSMIQQLQKISKALRDTVMIRAINDVLARGEDLDRDTYRGTLLDKFEPLAGESFKGSEMENMLLGSVAQYCMNKGAQHPWGANKARDKQRKSRRYAQAKTAVVH